MLGNELLSGGGALIKRINYQNFAGCEAATITLTANYELFAEYFLHHFVGEKCNYSTVTFLGICFLNEKFNCFLNMFSSRSIFPSKVHVFSGKIHVSFPSKLHVFEKTRFFG